MSNKLLPYHIHVFLNRITVKCEYTHVYKIGYLYNSIAIYYQSQGMKRYAVKCLKKLCDIHTYKPIYTPTPTYIYIYTHIHTYIYIHHCICRTHTHMQNIQTPIHIMATDTMIIISTGELQK